MLVFCPPLHAQARPRRLLMFRIGVTTPEFRADPLLFFFLAGRMAWDASRNPQLPKLWCGFFFQRATLSVLRIAPGNHCLSVLLRNDVHWQQTLSALWRGSGSS
jgi:hypothetical protein